MAMALRQMSAAKYGHPRVEVEQDIDARYVSAATNKPPQAGPSLPSDTTKPQGSFIDQWLSKRQAPGSASGATVPNQPSTSPSPQTPPTAAPNEVTVDLREQ
jgi:hypothetical protein